MPKVSIATDGAAIRRHRQLAGWNSTPFANHIGITVGYLSRLEGGHRHASAAMLKRIADALNVPIVDLVAAKKTVERAAV